MNQPDAFPSLNLARSLLFVQGAPSLEIGLICAGQGNHQIQLRAAIDREADRAEHAVQFSESPKSIDINRRKRGCLSYQLFVGHDFSPRNARSHKATTYDDPKLNSLDREKFPLRAASCPISKQPKNISVMPEQITGIRP